MGEGRGVGAQIEASMVREEVGQRQEQGPGALPHQGGVWNLGPGQRVGQSYWQLIQGVQEVEGEP